MILQVILAATIAAPAPAPIPWTDSEVFRLSNPCGCGDYQLVLPTFPSDTTWVRVDLGVETDMWFGIEGTGVSTVWGKFYDGGATYKVQWQGSTTVNLNSQTREWDETDCLTTAGYDPIGPYDNVLDYDGSHPNYMGSGGFAEAYNALGTATGAVCTRSDVLNGLKAGDDLYLSRTWWDFLVQVGGSPVVTDNRSTVAVYVEVEWGN